MKLTAYEVERINSFSKRALGAWGEAKAVEYLESLGYEIIARNWRCRYGEIDIIACSPQEKALLAVEVKTRRTIQAGTPEESITFKKRHRLRILISEWLARNYRQSEAFSREEIKLQAIAIDLCGEKYKLRYLQEL